MTPLTADIPRLRGRAAAWEAQRRVELLARARLLLVDPDDVLTRALAEVFRTEGYAVETVRDPTRGLARVAGWQPHLVILELVLGAADGFDMLHAVREVAPGVGILVLTSRALEADKVHAFHAGADDYLTKPFGSAELVARVGVLTGRRRSAMPTPALGQPGPRATHEFGEVVVDLAARCVSRGGRPVCLTPKEFGLLCALVSEPRRVQARDTLLRTVWATAPGVVSRTVDLHMVELRRKLEADPSNPRYLRTVRGVGYRFDP